MAGAKSDHVLVETRNFKDLSIPLTKTSRLRYTSLSASDKVLALGSNTGGIYIFSKSDCRLLQVSFADKETAAVNQLLISPNEKFVAFTVSTGKVHVIDLKLDSRSKSETLRSVTDLGGASVTCLKWDGTSNKLYIGDDLGKVSMVPVHTSKAKNLFSIPMEVILRLDSAVVQIDKSDEKLLVSTMSRCYLCYTLKQQYTQIGKKPRDGQYGACFFSQQSSASMIYCARPGSRIWEVDTDGGVLNTHQFKQLLAVPPLSILDINRKFILPDEKAEYSGQSVAFPKLKIISESFLLTWNATHIYILDPVNVRLILWTDQLNGIADICCVDDEIYVFLQSMQVQCLTLMPVPKAIQVCMADMKMETVARLCCFYGNILHKKHHRKHLGVPELYKIYDTLIENEMLELGANVLSCIKDIETRVAMQSDTDNSDSCRSRSGSVQSASSEHLALSTDGKPSTNDNRGNIANKEDTISEHLTLSTDSKQSANDNEEDTSSGHLTLSADVRPSTGDGRGQKLNKDADNDLIVHGTDRDPQLSGSADKEKKKSGFHAWTEKADVPREHIGEIVEIDYLDSRVSNVNPERTSLQTKDQETLDDVDDVINVPGIHNVKNIDETTTSNILESDYSQIIHVENNFSEIGGTTHIGAGIGNNERYKNGIESLTNSGSNVTETIQIERSLCAVDAERGEPDGNSCREEFNENEIEMIKTGSQLSPHTENLTGEDYTEEAVPDILASVDKSVFQCNFDNENKDNNHIIPFNDNLNALSRSELNAEQPSANDTNEPTDVPETSLQGPGFQALVESPSITEEIIKEDLTDIFEEDDTILFNSTKSFGPRRQSLTSLSSLSSAEVMLDPPYTVGLSPEPREQIAVKVKRRSPSRKKKRKSSPDIIGATLQTHGSPPSLGQLSSMTESPVGVTIAETVDTDTQHIPHAGIVIDQTDGITMESVLEDQQGPALFLEKSTDDLYGSGEFQKSSEWSVSGEFSAQETALLQSWEASKEDLSGSPSSAPKAAFLKFKTKLESKVSTKTKKFIKNIKDKNLLTKAKEMAAETFSQNSDVSITAGGYFEPDQFESFDQLGQIDPDTNVKVKTDGSIEDTKNDQLIDINELQEITDKVKTHLDNAQILSSITAVHQLLLEWVTVLNKTFHKFHVTRFAPSLRHNESSTCCEIVPNDSSNSTQNKPELDVGVHDNPDTNINVNTESEASKDSEVPNCEEKVSESDLKLASDNFEKILSDPDFCYLTDPLQLPVHLSRNVSTLVHACFDIGCHGDILTYQQLSPRTKAFCDTNSGSNEFQIEADTSEVVDSNIWDKSVPIEPDDNVTASSDSQTPVIVDTKEQVKQPDGIKMLGTVSGECLVKTIEGLPTDSISIIKQPEKNRVKTDSDSKQYSDCDGVTERPMNFFIRLYYPYLQLHKIDKGNMDYSEWSALVVCLQGCAIDEGERLGVKDDSILSHILESRHQKHPSLLLLGHVSRLFFSDDPNIISAALRCFPHIQPIDVLNLCRLHNKPVQTVFKQYMVQMLEHLQTIHKPDLEECLFSDRDVRHAWLELLLREDSILDRVKDVNGNPRPMTHKLDRKNSSLIDQVLSKLSLYELSDLRDMMSLCHHHGYWNGVLRLLKHLRCVDEHFRIVLYLGDCGLLSHSNPYGYLPVTLQEWELLLTTFKELADTGNQQSPDWSSTVTWNSLAILLVKNVGPDLALSLLEKCGVAEGDLSTEFYQTCLLSGVVQKHKSLILHSMLEKVDTYLWSQRSAVVIPQVHYLLVNEKRLQSGSKLASPGQGEQNVDSLTTSLKEDKAVQLSPYTEDPECHWGVKAKFNMYCGCCTISLKEIVSHSESGILLFRCGHGFHKQCLPERQCILCEEDLD